MDCKNEVMKGKLLVNNCLYDVVSNFPYLLSCEILEGGIKIGNELSINGCAFVEVHKIEAHKIKGYKGLCVLNVSKLTDFEIHTLVGKEMDIMATTPTG